MVFNMSRLEDTEVEDTPKYSMCSVGIYNIPALIRVHGLSVSVLTFRIDVKHTLEQLN